MSTKKEMVFDVVLQNPGITESEIAKVLYGPSGFQQQVNYAIRALRRDGLIFKSRRLSDGKNGLYVDDGRSVGDILEEGYEHSKDPYPVLREASEPSLLNRREINDTVPQLPGIYWLLQKEPYPRYIGQSIILKIGMSKEDLRKELLNNLSGHVAARGVELLRNKTGVDVFFSFSCTHSKAVPVLSNLVRGYAYLLQEFEKEHIDLPLLNRQGY